MIYTIASWLVFVALLVFIGLPMLPYLLWRKWVKGIPLTEKEKRPDFDCSEPEPVE